MTYFESMSLYSLSGLLVRHISFQFDVYSIFKLFSYSSTFMEMFSGLFFIFLKHATDSFLIICQKAKTTEFSSPSSQTYTIT